MARPEQLANGKYRVRWIDYDQVRRSKVFDSKSAAGIYLKQRQVEAHEIKNGLKAPPQPVMTFFQLSDHWLKYRAANKRSGYHDESIIRTHLKPIIGDIEIRTIRPSHGDQIKLKLKDRSNKTVHNILTLFGAMLNCAYAEGWLMREIKLSKPKIPIVDKEFRYLKTKEEIIGFLTAAMEIDENVHDLFAFAIHTGMRAGEIGNLRFCDLDFDNDLIHVTGSWGGVTKSGEARVIPMLPALKPILLKRMKSKVSSYVFCNQLGNPLKPSDRIFQEKLKATLDRAGFPKTTIRGEEKHYINFHGLRHTFASHWMMSGLDLFRLQKILGHQSADITSRYSHLHVSAYSDLQDKALNAIPDIQTENVVSFNGKNVRNVGQMGDIPYQTPSVSGSV